jgi:hypothetical protein
MNRGCGVFVVAVAGEGGIGEASGVARLSLGEALTFAIEDELAVVDEGHAVGVCESFCAFSYKVNMGALFEDKARGVDGIADAFDAGDATGFHAATVHEERVELDAAIGGEEAAATGVEGGIVFEDGDCGFDCIDCGTAAGEDFVTDLEGVAHACFVGGGRFRGDGPGATVNEEGWIVGGRLRAHSDMVVHDGRGACQLRALSRSR